MVLAQTPAATRVFSPDRTTEQQRRVSGIQQKTDELDAEQLEELDVERPMAFAERILPRAADLWVQSSLDHKQRLTAPLFSYLRDETWVGNDLVSPLGIEPRTNRLRVFGRAKSRRRRM